jgi:LPS sulfotransferase NodH
MEDKMQVHTSYLICATPRSGSTFLCEVLQNTGIAGYPEEYFQALEKTGLPRDPQAYFEGLDPAERADITPYLAPFAQANPEPAQPVSAEAYLDYLATVLQRGSTPNDVFGAKIMWGYFNDLVRKLRDIPGYSEMPAPDLLSTVFPHLHYIWIRRHDKVRQAVSLWKALQTWTWRQEDLSPRPNVSAGSRKPIFHFKAIDHLVQQIEADEAAWQHYFRSYDIQPFIVEYEELTVAYEEIELEILQFLGIPIPEEFVFIEPRMKRQADALSEEWVQRYHRLKGLDKA